MNDPELEALRELEQLVREIMSSSAPMVAYTSDLEKALSTLDIARSLDNDQKDDG